MKKLLLHVCCAPCASACVERLLAEKYEIALYYSNSNIETLEEYEKRLDCVRQLADHYRLALFVDDYRHDKWLASIGSVANYEKEPERGLRCHACFAYSLERTASKAMESGMSFATSLTVSPHKNTGIIFEIGKHFPGFEPIDFKKKDGFKRSLELSKTYHFYRQTFCGCEFSRRS